MGREHAPVMQYKKRESSESRKLKADEEQRRLRLQDKLCKDKEIINMEEVNVVCELLGVWSDTVGVILICLLPKPCGGRRPIGRRPVPERTRH